MLLEEGITPSRKSLEDVKEATTHQNVFFEMLRHDKGMKKRRIKLDLILRWHRELFMSTKPDIAGQIRKHQVLISGSRFIPPTPVEVYPMLVDFFRWYDSTSGFIRNKRKNIGEIVTHPVELAALIHLKFVTIHPFSDGNGRISRLLMNYMLNRHGFPMLNITYSRRSSYHNALERSQITKDDSIFTRWFFRRYLDANMVYPS